MRGKCIKIIMIGVIFSIVSFGVFNSQVLAGEFKDVPVKGMVTMVDLGAKSCFPCKMMAPILKKVEKDYKGKASIIFIDVWKNRDQARRFGIRAIPTQIFFDKDGKEVYRHLGFMNEKTIISQLKKMGVQKAENVSKK